MNTDCGTQPGGQRAHRLSKADEARDRLCAAFFEDRSQRDFSALGPELREALTWRAAGKERKLLAARDVRVASDALRRFYHEIRTRFGSVEALVALNFGQELRNWLAILPSAGPVQDPPPRQRVDEVVARIAQITPRPERLQLLSILSRDSRLPENTRLELTKQAAKLRREMANCRGVE